MASTKVALFYSKTTGRLRWWLVPDSDTELNNLQSNNSGEGVLVVSRAQYLSALGHDHLQGFITLVTGLVPNNDRYAIVQNGVVTGIVIADPVGCNEPTPQGAILSAVAQVGWTLAGGVLVAPASAVV